MIYGNRDRDLHTVRTRKNHACYGMGLGIMVLDDAYPGFPGDVRNASAFPFPVQYEIAAGVDNYTLVWEPDKSPCRDPILRAAARLERMGCRLSRRNAAILPISKKTWPPTSRYRCSCPACCRYRSSSR